MKILSLLQLIYLEYKQSTFEGSSWIIAQQTGPSLIFHNTLSPEHCKDDFCAFIHSPSFEGYPQCEQSMQVWQEVKFLQSSIIHIPKWGHWLGCFSAYSLSKVIYNGSLTHSQVVMMLIDDWWRFKTIPNSLTIDRHLKVIHSIEKFQICKLVTSPRLTALKQSLHKEWWSMTTLEDEVWGMKFDSSLTWHPWQSLQEF